jgi:fumarate hydratase class II
MRKRERYRIERDSLGEVRVPEEALYGAQTQRAVENFPLGDGALPPRFIHALGLIKAAAARANAALGRLEPERAAAIAEAAEAVARGEHDHHFPVSVFQTGSGTSSNMNANEVIASLSGRRLGGPVHPNDEVNRGQSSNDVIPTAIHLGAALALRQLLLPALAELAAGVERRAGELAGVVKTGRTHLMDALPLTLGQELGAWAQLVRADLARFEGIMPRLLLIAQGGTAVGTGLNAHPGFPRQFAGELARATGLPFQPAADAFAAISSQDTAVELSGLLRVASTTLGKIAEDLRWMNSGPLAGLGEIRLPALQPGSSIMPGKVNPVIPEAVLMACIQVSGRDHAVALAGRSGNFQLNTMLPLIADNLLRSIELLAGAARLLAEKAIAGFTVDRERLEAALARNPILVTALNERLGYEQGAAIAKRAYAEKRPVLDVAAEMTDIPRDELTRLLDPAALTGTPGEKTMITDHGDS